MQYGFGCLQLLNKNTYALNIIFIWLKWFFINLCIIVIVILRLLDHDKKWSSKYEHLFLYAKTDPPN
jgi:hypothetical protein